MHIRTLCLLPIADILIHPEHKAYAFEADSAAHLTCVASGSPLPSVTWSKNGSTLSNSSGLYVHQVLVTDSGLIFVESVLQTCTAEESDYSCRADNLIGSESDTIDFPSNTEGRMRMSTAKSYTLILSVNLFPRIEPQPVQIVIHPAEVTMAEANNTLLLLCVGYGVPIPSMTWFKDGDLLTNDGNVTITESVVVENQSGTRFMRSMVKICSTGEVDSGFYECKAENEAGLSSYSTNLTVILGGTLSFYCLLCSYMHAAIFLIYAFLYSEKPQIVIHPENVTEYSGGSSVLFSCSAFGVPLPAISWSRDGEELGNSSRSIIYQEVVAEGGVTFLKSILEICRARSLDAGTYSCSGNNVIDNDTASFEFAVDSVEGKA